jgi:hypothetical protein
MFYEHRRKRLCISTQKAAKMSTEREVSNSVWTPLQFLVGRWVGEGDGGPGQGSGWCTFREDLQGKILVRTNHAEYPPVPDRPAVAHDDLMYIYPDPADRRLRAIYFDVEGHVIHYRVEASEAGDAVQFLSDATPASAGYRLTYRRTSRDTLHLMFEVAPPGKPNEFTAYIEADLRRAQSD